MSDIQTAWSPDRAHNQLPALPPGHDLESKAVLRACIAARAALAELKQAAELIPNQTMLINTIPLLEAKDSSEIENIVTTTDQLFQHVEGSGQADHEPKKPCVTELHCTMAIGHSNPGHCARPLRSRCVAPSRVQTWISGEHPAPNWRTTGQEK